MLYSVETHQPCRPQHPYMYIYIYTHTKLMHRPGNGRPPKPLKTKTKTLKLPDQDYFGPKKMHPRNEATSISLAKASATLEFLESVEPLAVEASEIFRPGSVLPSGVVRDLPDVPT